jgi:glycosyltransferase involved in cell wall biosynthesis
MGGQAMVPVILTEPRVYGPGEAGHNLAHPTQLALRAAGYASCYGVYWSKWEKQSAIDAAAQYCTPGVLKAIDERAFVVDALVDVDPAMAASPRPAKPRRLLFAGRLNSNKRYQEVLDAYAKVLMARPVGEVEVWVHAGTGAFGKLEKAFHRWHRTSERLDHAAFHELIATAHVGCYLSRDEGANVTTQELIASGIVMALPDRSWVHKLFHPLTYPFIARSETELPALLDWLLDHYEEAHQQLEPIRQLIYAERSWASFLSKFQAVVDVIKAAPRPDPYRVFRDVVTEMQATRPVDQAAVPFGSALRMFPHWRTSAPQYSAIRGSYASYLAVKDMDDMQHADPLLVPTEAS